MKIHVEKLSNLLASTVMFASCGKQGEPDVGTPGIEDEAVCLIKPYFFFSLLTI